MTKPLSALVIGAGDRGRAWMTHSESSGAGIFPIAVADPNEEAREVYGEKYGLVNGLRFKSADEALTSDFARSTKGFDVVLITTPDATHRDIAVKALETGHNILLEKPIATTKQGCYDVIEAQKQAGTVLSLGHVLRFSPFFNTIRDITKSGEYGKLVDVYLSEDVADWHFAHSYVRGPWRNSETSSPVIIAKSCHDLDVIDELVNSPVKSVTSEGSRKFFTSENAPEGAKQKCTDGCDIEKCRFDARKFYLGKHTETPKGVRWPYANIAVLPHNASIEETRERRQKSIETTSFGNCVYNSDNDQSDNQTVLMEFENGVRANFSLSAFGNVSDRNIRLIFEEGEVSGNLLSGKIRKQRYHGIRDIVDVEELSLSDMNCHGGGDPFLIKNFADLVRNPDPEKIKALAKEGLQSHLIAFAAEESRKTGQRVTF